MTAIPRTWAHAYSFRNLAHEQDVFSHLLSSMVTFKNWDCHFVYVSNFLQYSNLPRLVFLDFTDEECLLSSRDVHFGPQNLFQSMQFSSQTVSSFREKRWNASPLTKSFNKMKRALIQFAIIPNFISFLPEDDANVIFISLCPQCPFQVKSLKFSITWNVEKIFILIAQVKKRTNREMI